MGGIGGNIVALFLTKVTGNWFFVEWGSEKSNCNTFLTSDSFTFYLLQNYFYREIPKTPLAKRFIRAIFQKTHVTIDKKACQSSAQNSRTLTKTGTHSPQVSQAECGVF